MSLAFATLTPAEYVGLTVAAWAALPLVSSGVGVVFYSEVPAAHVVGAEFSAAYVPAVEFSAAYVVGAEFVAVHRPGSDISGAYPVGT